METREKLAALGFSEAEISDAIALLGTTFPEEIEKEAAAEVELDETAGNYFNYGYEYGLDQISKFVDGVEDTEKTASEVPSPSDYLEKDAEYQTEAAAAAGFIFQGFLSGLDDFDAEYEKEAKAKVKPAFLKKLYSKGKHVLESAKGVAGTPAARAAGVGAAAGAAGGAAGSAVSKEAANMGTEAKILEDLAKRMGQKLSPWEKAKVHAKVVGGHAQELGKKVLETAKKPGVVGAASTLGGAALGAGIVRKLTHKKED